MIKCAHTESFCLIIFIRVSFLFRWLWSKTWRWQTTLWYKCFFTFLQIFGVIVVSGYNDVSCYNVSGYGGFGTGGTGLPGGPGGPGSKPGYPVGTGVCAFVNVMLIDMEQKDRKYKCLMYFFFLQE